MDCLKDRIGIKGCGVTYEVPPQLYINSLPGVTLGMIDALANEEQETFIGLWNDVALRTMKRFELAVKSQLNKCYKLTDKTVVECLVCEKKDLFDVALWYLHGVELMIERTSTDEMSRYTTIDLDKAEKLKQDFFIEFESSLNDAVNSMGPKDSDCLLSCLECNDTVKWVMQTP